MPQAGLGVERPLRYNGGVCTVTWFDESDGYQVFFNRDERRQRRPGLPPEVRRSGSTRFVAPLDGDFGGTWIAANEFGLTVCLLNGPAAAGEQPSLPPSASTSRGHVPLSVIEHRTTPGVRAALRPAGLARFRPFVLVLFDSIGTGLVAAWSGVELRVREGRPDGPPLVSSSFSTQEVRRNRAAVYHRMLRTHRGADRSRLHLAYHRSHDPTAGPDSPCMHRPDACTVSFTRVRVRPAEVRLDYCPHAPCRGLPRDPGIALPRRRPD
jgi:hypothetical protein